MKTERKTALWLTPLLVVGCLDTEPTVTGKRVFAVDAGSDAPVVTDPPLAELPNCVKCEAALGLDSRYKDPTCRTDSTSLSLLSSQGLFNNVVEQCCTGACATQCSGFCTGGAISTECSTCMATVAACDTAVNACKERK